jgi:hypothetical protein
VADAGATWKVPAGSGATRSVSVDAGLVPWLGPDASSTVGRAVTSLVAAAVVGLVPLDEEALVRRAGETGQPTSFEQVVARAVLVERRRLGDVGSSHALRREAEVIRRNAELTGRPLRPEEVVRRAVALALAGSVEPRADPECPLCHGDGKLLAHRRALDEIPCQCVGRGAPKEDA